MAVQPAARASRVLDAQSVERDFDQEVMFVAVISSTGLADRSGRQSGAVKGGTPLARWESAGDASTVP